VYSCLWHLNWSHLLQNVLIWKMHLWEGGCFSVKLWVRMHQSFQHQWQMTGVKCCANKSNAHLIISRNNKIKHFSAYSLAQNYLTMFFLSSFTLSDLFFSYCIKDPGTCIVREAVRGVRRFRNAHICLQKDPVDPCWLEKMAKFTLHRPRRQADAETMKCLSEIPQPWD